MNAKPKTLRVTGFRGNPTRLVLNNGTEALVTNKIINAMSTCEKDLKIAAQRVVDKWWSFYGHGTENCMEDDATNNAIADLRLLMMGNYAELDEELKKAIANDQDQGGK
jgi:hypothetical protein